MKNIITLSAILIATTVSAAELSAPNEERTLTTGITWVAAGATSNALSTAYLEIKNHEEVSVQWQSVWSATNAPAAASTQTATFGVSMVPSNFVPIVAVSTPVSSTATTAVNLGTNVYIGSFRYFGLISIANGGTNSVSTNSSPTGTAGQMKLQFKDRRNG